MHDVKLLLLLPLAALTDTSVAQSRTSLNASCYAQLTELGEGVPTPAPALASWLGSVVGVSSIGAGDYTAAGQTTVPPNRALEDPDAATDFFCSVQRAGLPASLVSDFRSYGQGLLSHASVHVSQYDAYITDCVTTGAAAASITSAYHAMISHAGAPVCPDSSSSSAIPGSSPNGTSSIPSPTASSTLVPTAAASRATGTFIGAAAVGGLLGLVASL